jgi:hypothetical protein
VFCGGALRGDRVSPANPCYILTAAVRPLFIANRCFQRIRSLLSSRALSCCAGARASLRRRRSEGIRPGCLACAHWPKSSGAKAKRKPERRYRQARQVKTDVEMIARTEGGGGKSEPGKAGVVPPAEVSGVESAWRQVKGPGTGLIVTAILNWVAIPLLVLIAGAVIMGKGMTANLPLVLVPLSALAREYATGEGVPQDRVEAYKWAAVAAKQPDPNSGDATMRELRDQLTPDQLAEAKRRLKEFAPKRTSPADP